MKKKKILIVEDEKYIINFIKNRLNKNLYDIDMAVDGNEAMSKILEKKYDLVTLDLMLPFVDGFEICQQIRTKNKKSIIVIVSALNTLEYKEKGYELGADDYISKPFSAKELSIKIDSLLKRKKELIADATNSEIFKDIIIDEGKKEIIINGFKLDFTPSEYLILATLIKNKNIAFSRSDLVELIYYSNYGQIDENGINTHIYNIREKIKKVYKKDIIKTVRGIGYRISED